MERSEKPPPMDKSYLAVSVSGCVCSGIASYGMCEYTYPSKGQLPTCIESVQANPEPAAPQWSP